MGLRTIIVDDHDVVRAGLRVVLGKMPDVQVVGEAADGHAAIQLVAQLQPDLVLMDLSMPHLNGLEASRRITADAGSVRVIVITMHADRQYVIEALKAGAAGYVLKKNVAQELPAAIPAVMDGKSYLSPEIAHIVVGDFVRQSSEPGRGASDVLTAREREVLQMVAEGLTTKEIAGSLGIATKTIESHRSQLMTKLKIHSVAGLTKYAIGEGLTSVAQ